MDTKEEKKSRGMIYLVATPIGNLGDISFRALEILAASDLIAAEDTRNTIKLLNHYQIAKPMRSYHEHNKIERAYELIEEAREGKLVAVVTDAGMPAISDPGEDLVRIAYEEGIEVSLVPGACAALGALALSGLPGRNFVFEGFLPLPKKERENVLKSLEHEYRTIILYEAPHRLLKTLKELSALFGRERMAVLVRELTKKHEEVIRGELGLLEEEYESGQRIPRGEYVLVIRGRSREEDEKQNQLAWNALSMDEHMAIYEGRGIAQKEAMKMVAKDRGISKREVYQSLLKNRSPARQ
ncbi:MAG: 16S rRNA (cytidine(1402)-2'-O)-methyltransferase [Johnsonella sp.]|nr:16S rRNA (cytidine(1402)-2'-O)-methyltransferase [Johnsonella sp.]